VGWHNVDGDFVNQSKDSEGLKTWKKIGDVFGKWTLGQELGEQDHESWKEYYTILCKEALKQASEGSNVCVSFVAYKPYVREFVRTLS
jgi:hypothetical protein